MNFTVWPREGIIKEEPTMTMLLTDDLRSFPIEMVPAALYGRNHGLSGSFKVTHVKTFGEGDFTQNRVSKQGWRLLKIKGDKEFSESLYNFVEDYRFQLGSSYVQIRGGNRRTPTSLEEVQAKAEAEKRRARRERLKMKSAEGHSNKEKEIQKEGDNMNSLGRLAALQGEDDAPGRADVT